MRHQKTFILLMLVLGLVTSVVSYTFFVKELTFETVLETKDFNLDVEVKLGQLDIDPTSIYFDNDKNV